MTFSYDNEALTEALNRIRLEIGDTNEDRQLLQDEEINEIIADQTNYSVQVAKCCRLVAAKFAAKPQLIKLEGFQENTTEVYNRFIQMAKDWEAKASYPWAGSTEASWKETVEADTSLVTPKFKLGMHDNS